MKPKGLGENPDGFQGMQKARTSTWAQSFSDAMNRLKSLPGRTKYHIFKQLRIPTTNQLPLEEADFQPSKTLGSVPPTKTPLKEFHTASA